MLHGSFESCDWNERSFNASMRSDWRLSLVSAAAVVSALIDLLIRGAHDVPKIYTALAEPATNHPF